MIKKIFFSVFVVLLSNLVAQEQLTNENITSADYGSISSGFNTKGSRFIEFDGKFFFYATTPEFGKEIWYSDGSVGGARLLKDINRGSLSIGISGKFADIATVFKNELYFLLRDGLWKTNGTEEGTVQVKELEIGGNGSSGNSAIIALSENELLIFQNPGFGIPVSLWKTDGTQEGTVLVSDTIGDVLSSFGTYVKKAEGKVFFISNPFSGPRDRKVWVTDGTTLGTVRLFSGENISIPRDSAVLNNEFYILYTEDFGATHHLLKTDGTIAGTKTIKDFNNLAYDYLNDFDLYSVNDKIYISIVEGFDTEYKHTIYQSDGTELGTEEVYSNITTSIGKFYSNLNSSNDFLIFTSSDSLGETSLFTMDLIDYTVSEVGKLGKINNTPFEGLINIQKIPNNQYFISEGSTTLPLSENKAWIFDLTTGNMEQVDNLSGVLVVFEFNDQFYFPKFTGEIRSGELWGSGGTNDNTVLIDDLNQRKFGLSFALNYVTTLNNNLLYYEGNRSSKIYSFNTNTLNFDKIIDESTFYATDNINNFGNGSPLFRGERYFIFNSNPSNGTIFTPENNQIKIIKTDGTKDGTVIFDEIPFTSEDRFISHALTYNDDLYFIEYRLPNAPDTSPRTYQVLLTIYDGVNYKVIKDFGEQKFPYSPNVESYMIDNKFYIISRELFGSNLSRSRTWSSDGSTSGTNEYIVNASDPVIYNNELYFSGSTDNSNERGLMKINTIMNSIETIKDIETNTSDEVDNLFVANNVLFFTAKSNEYGNELWKTDGTETGTVLIKDITPGVDSSFTGGCRLFCKKQFTVLNNEVYFYDRLLNSLWRTDGTETGTVMIKDSRVTEFTTIGDYVYFDSWDVPYGRELWRTNGTEEGTSLVFDLSPGASDSFPRSLANIGNDIYFFADTDATGRQLWKYREETLSVEEHIETQESSFIYPNPTADIIRFKGPEHIKNIKIFNMNGVEVLFNKELNNNVLNVNSLPVGMYMVTYSKNGINVVQKLIRK